MYRIEARWLYHVGRKPGGVNGVRWDLFFQRLCSAGD